MDEPFGALDALTRVQMQDDLLGTWQQERKTVVFITHDVDEAVYLASRVVVMSPRPGRISEIVDVPLPYPRNEDLRLSPEFAEIRARVWRGVHHREGAAPAHPATRQPMRCLAMNLEKRKSLRAATALLAGAGIGALGWTSAAPAPRPRAPVVSLNIGYIDTSINGVGVIAAANKLDLWKKAGINAKLIPFTNGPTQIQAMAGGSLDIGYIGGGAVWMPASGQAVIITPNEKSFGDYVLARPESGIKTVKDLRGRKVGVPDSGSGEMILAMALDANGMSFKDIQRIPLDPPQRGVGLHLGPDRGGRHLLAHRQPDPRTHSRPPCWWPTTATSPTPSSWAAGWRPTRRWPARPTR